MRFVTIILCWCTFTFATASSQAEQQTNKTYRVGVEDVNYLPFFTSPQASEPRGMLIDVLSEFGKQNGLEFELVYLPIARFFSWYEQDAIDFRLPDNPRWHGQASKNFVFSQSIIDIVTTTVVLQKNQNIDVKEIQNIGLLYGFTPSDFWTEREQQGLVNIVSNSSLKVLVRLLKQGVVDGLDLELAVIRHYAKNLSYEPNQFVASANVPVKRHGYSISTKSHPQIIALFDQFLLEQSDKITQLDEQYQISKLRRQLLKSR